MLKSDAASERAPSMMPSSRQYRKPCLQCNTMRIDAVRVSTSLKTWALQRCATRCIHCNYTPNHAVAATKLRTVNVTHCSGQLCDCHNFHCDAVSDAAFQTMLSVSGPRLQMMQSAQYQFKRCDQCNFIPHNYVEQPYSKRCCNFDYIHNDAGSITSETMLWVRFIKRMLWIQRLKRFIHLMYEDRMLKFICTGRQNTCCKKFTSFTDSDETFHLQNMIKAYTTSIEELRSCADSEMSGCIYYHDRYCVVSAHLSTHCIFLWRAELLHRSLAITSLIVWLKSCVALLVWFLGIHNAHCLTPYLGINSCVVFSQLSHFMRRFYLHAARDLQRMIIPTLLVQASCCFPPDTHADDSLCVAVYAEYSELKETEDYVWGPEGLGLSACRLQRLSKTWKRAVDVRELLLSSACWLHGWRTERDEKIREIHFNMSIWALHAQC